MTRDDLEERDKLIEGLAALNYHYKYGEHAFSDEEQSIVSEAIIELQKEKPVLYACDRNACHECSSVDCHHTTDITHAVNFEIGIDGNYYFEKLPDKRDCRFCVYNGYRCTNPADITVDKDGKCSGHTTKLEDSEND